jgi:predicted DNA-binding transcriptional regulator AlpA
MLQSTIAALTAVLRTDETVTPRDRARVLTSVRRALDASTKAEPAGANVARIVRRKEGASRLGMSTRTFDKLCSEGVFKKHVLPGRKRAIGILESDLVALLTTQKDASV